MRNYFLFVALSSFTLFAQPPTSRHILLDVAVTDQFGHRASGLAQQDFTLYDNKQPLALSSFHAIDGETPEHPLEVVFVIDEVNTGYQFVEVLRQQLHDFFARDGAHLTHPASLIVFTDKGLAIHNTPTKNGNALIAQLDEHAHGLRVGRTAQGIYGAMERMQISIRALEEIVQFEAKRPGRKLVVWISPGWALLSGPHVALSRKNEEAIFEMAITVSQQLRDSDITLYSVDPLGMADTGALGVNYYQEFLKPVNKANQVQLGILSLQVLATQSGGLALSSSNDIGSQLARCVRDADTYYELTFDPPPTSNPAPFHQIEIKVNQPALTVRTRYGYYAQP